MKCPKCGTEHESNFCPNCGTPAQPATTTSHSECSKGAPQKSGGVARKIVLFFVVIFIGSLIFGIVRIIQNPEQYQKQEESVPVVLDCSKFSRISTEELKAELGEPKTIEDWTNKTTKGDFPMQILSYDFEDFYGEFIVYEDAVVKAMLFSDSRWEVPRKDMTNIFSMFGVTPDKNARTIVNNGITFKFSPVSDKVAQFDIYDFDKESNTFRTVFVTYNLKYFN